MTKILDTIVAHKKTEVARNQVLVSVLDLQQQPNYLRKTYSLKKNLLTDTQSTGIIAEFKRKSPSKGIINGHSQVTDVAVGYMRAGAAALSILTDANFFGGSTADLLAARPLCNIPILRKDFIVDSYQIYEAKAMGADLILLIAACLSPSQIKEFAALAHDLGLEVLIEVHDETELLQNMESGADLIGVNNRNLQTFEVNLATSVQLAKLMPPNAISIAESGITSYKEVEFLKQHGYKGFLIGENFMKQSNPAEGLRSFLEV
jgi:indole-3-glycerol phosphate synthase